MDASSHCLLISVVVGKCHVCDSIIPRGIALSSGESAEDGVDVGSLRFHVGYEFRCRIDTRNPVELFLSRVLESRINSRCVLSLSSREDFPSRRDNTKKVARRRLASFPKCIPMNCIYVDRINSLVVLRDHEFVEFNEIVVTFRIVIRVDLMRQALFA